MPRATIARSLEEDNNQPKSETGPAVQEIIYALRVPDAPSPARARLAELLELSSENLPEWVRISTLAPLSNQGYPPEARAAVLAIKAEGVVLGTEGAPRIFVPWQNIAYIGEGVFS